MRIYRFYNLVKRYSSLKNSLQFLRYLYACRSQIFLNLIWVPNILGTIKNFRNRRNLFSSLLSTIFYKGSGKFNETFFTLSSLEYNIFSTAGFCFLIILKFKKKLTSLLVSFALPKNKNSEAPIVGTLPLLFPVLFCSKCWMCVFCLFTPFIYTSLIASNEQIYNFFKWVIFEKKKHCGK